MYFAASAAWSSFPTVSFAKLNASGTVFTVSSLCLYYGNFGFVCMCECVLDSALCFCEFAARQASIKRNYDCDLTCRAATALYAANKRHSRRYVTQAKGFQNSTFVCTRMCLCDQRQLTSDAIKLRFVALEAIIFCISDLFASSSLSLALAKQSSHILMQIYVCVCTDVYR